jgi:hypothetical protein
MRREAEWQKRDGTFVKQNTKVRLAKEFGKLRPRGAKSLGDKHSDAKPDWESGRSPWHRSIDNPNERVNALPDSLRFNVNRALSKAFNVAAAPVATSLHARSKNLFRLRRPDGSRIELAREN